MGRVNFTAENEIQHLTLVRRVCRADSFFTRLRGLTFRRRLGADEGLWLIWERESRIEAAIHMFFVFFPIGAVWLDGENCVVDKVVARPFRPFYAPRAPASSVLECQPEVLQRLAVGDKIRFIPCEVEDEA
jgi:uncharacterized membrane protein (UPF0127 family)